MKKHLINAGYFVVMIISALFMLRSCVNLAHAQANPGYSLRGVLRTAIKADSLWTVDTTIQADSTFGALNPANSLRVGEPTEAWQWDTAKLEWENSIITAPSIRGDSLFIDDSTFVLLQRLNKSKFGWVTDSIKWVVTDTTFEGEPDCKHDWVYGNIKHGSIDFHFTMGFEIVDCTWLNPDGQHCNEHQSATREKICRKCSRGEIEREHWYQRFVAPPKSEFELLKEKQNARHR